MFKKVFLIYLVSFAVACSKNEVFDKVDKAQKVRNVKWNPTIAFPLVYADLNAQDLIKETETDLIRVEDDQSLTLVYTSTIFSLRAEEVFQLPNQVFSTSINLNAGQIAALNSQDSVRINISTVFGMSAGGNELDSIIYKSGKLEMELSSTLPQKVSATASIRGGQRNGNPISKQIVVSYGGLPDPPAYSLETVPLDGAKIDFTQGPQNHSQLSADFSVLIEKTGNAVVSGSQSITINLTFRDQRYKVVHGYINSYDISNGTDTLKAKVFSQSRPGSFTLLNPAIKFIFTNSFGVPVSVTFDEARGRSVNDQVIDLNGIPSPIIVPAPGISEVGQTVKDSFQLNKDNSNLEAYINNQPYYNYFRYNLDLNPGNPSQRNFVTDSSVLECKAISELRMHGTARDYSLEAQLPFDLSLDDLDVIDSVLFRIYTENGFPIDIRLQVYFEDSISHQIYDSLLLEDILVMPSADVDGSGKVSEIYPKTIDVMIGQDRLKQISMANSIRLSGYFNTLFVGSSQPDVKLYEFYRLLIQLGIQATFKIDEKI